MGTRLKVLAHACKRGNMWASISLTPTKSSITSNQWATPPKAMSAIPILSPPKNFLSPRPCSSRALSISKLSFLAFSCSSPAVVRNNLQMQGPYHIRTRRTWLNSPSNSEEKKNEQIYLYLIFSKLNPKPCHSSFIRVIWQQWILRPHLFNVLKDYRWLTDRFSSMNKHWDHLVNRVVLQKHGTFIGKIFFYVLIWYVLQFQSPYDPVTKWTRPCSY